MFEHITFESIMERMLAAVVSSGRELDTRVASLIYSALAPAAVELQNMYITAGTILDEAFGDTASRDFLIRRCAERAITPEPAQPAIWSGLFDCDIPLGSRFSAETLNFIAAEKLQDGVFRLECETLGEAGNAASGRLIPIEHIAGLTKAELGELLIPGEEDEETEHLRARYLASFQTLAFGGNVADYKEKVNAMHGVGGCKVYRAWNGGGTVKVVVIDTLFRPPEAALVKEVQEALDPEAVHGEGLGLAPIGHTVTVEGVRTLTVDIETEIAYKPGYVWEDIKPYAQEAVDAYFLELAQAWADSGGGTVRISQIEARLLDLDGVEDIQNTRLNGADGNLPLGLDEIPVRGGLHGTEAA